MFVTSHSQKFSAANNRDLNSSQKKLLEDGKKLSQELETFKNAKAAEKREREMRAQQLIQSSKNLSRELDEFKRSQQS